MSFRPVVGLNLYTLRDFCRTEDDLDTTLGRLKGLGLPSVQASGLGPMSPETVRRLADAHGLTICAAHESLEALTQRPADVVAKLTTLGCRFTALGFPGHDQLAADKIPALRDALVAAGRVLAAAGFQLGYHNHSQELMPYEGTSMLAWLYDHSPADVLYAELDTAWLQQGGGSPEAWIRRLAGRLTAVHLKDYTWVEGKAQLCEVGRGNLDWPGIFGSLVETRVPLWIIEQDDAVPGRDLFDSVAISLERVLRAF
jgi:sugar phosphate isomerase/epimerase